MTSTPHDALFRAAFSVPARAGALLRHILPAGLVEAIRWDSLQSEQGVFVDRELDIHATDILFRAELAGYPHDEWVHFLFEHQSRVDRDMPLRLGDYHLCLCKQLRKDCAPGELPTVVPILVSHAVGGWTGPRCYDDMFTCHPAWFGLADYVPRFRMLLLDLARASDAELRSIGADPFAVATLWALREARNGGALLAQFDRYADVLRAMREQPNGRDDSHAWLRYILDAGDGVTAKQLIAAVHHYAPELTEIAMTAADQLRQEGLKQGLEQGLEQGRHNQVAMLASLLTQRFGPLPASHREQLDHASADQLRALAGQVLSVSSLDELFAGFDPER